MGRDYPLYIAREAVRSAAESIVDRSPSDTAVVLGRFAAATHQEVDRAVRAARVAQAAWAHRGWRERGALVRRAGQRIRVPKFQLAALMSLEAGKSRVGATGDAGGAGDLLDYYCPEVGGADGFGWQMD